MAPAPILRCSADSAALTPSLALRIATQTPDGAIHLISSRLHYRFNLPWLTAGTE
jgi:hypothetical protein